MDDVLLAGGPLAGRRCRLDAEPADGIVWVMSLLDAADEIAATGAAYIAVRRHRYRLLPGTVPPVLAYDPPAPAGVTTAIPGPRRTST
jgi:hypothetical protein